MIFTVPNILTTLRMLLLAPLLYLLELDAFVAATLLGAFIFITDFFDGQIARRYNQQSYLGSILDPVADKVVVLTLFGYFFYRDLVPAWYFALILLRDIAQLLSIPVLLLWMKIQFKVDPDPIAKWGTALNFIILGGVYLSLWAVDLGFAQAAAMLEWPLFVLYLISTPIEIYILVTYIPRFFQIMRGTHDTFN